MALLGYKIWVDAGHGGNPPSSTCDTYGTVGQLSGPEKDVNLYVANHLRSLLISSRATVQMTRTTDKVVCLADRIAQANNWGANIFVSIHHNGGIPEAHGTETFWYKNMDRSLAEFVHGRLVFRLGRNNRGVKQEGYRVLRETKMPAIITEAVFQTNPDDDAFIAQASNKETEAHAIWQGIILYAESLPPIR